MLKVISFDFWDTLFVDDSDEVERKILGLNTKGDQRIKSLWDKLEKEGVSYEQLVSAFSEANGWAKKRWIDHYVTISVEDRIKKVAELLRVNIKNGDLKDLTYEFENMEVEISPITEKGCEDVLSLLSRSYKLCLVSDTIYTPGRGIRKILEKNHLLDYFSFLSFSDEIGVSKPNPLVFNKALNQLKCSPREIVHIGDREKNDVVGAKKNGMRAILFDRSLEPEKTQTKADAKIYLLEELPNVIEKLNRGLI
jgi:putative hydrolase of the HAD superfamily